MEYVNTMCNQCCSEMECMGVCGKVKCFRNKPPSYSFSLKKDKTFGGKAAELLNVGFLKYMGVFSDRNP